MHFLSFIFDNILYMFRIGKLFIIRRWAYMRRSVCIVHLYRLAAISVKIELVYGYIFVDLLLFYFLINQQRYNHKPVPSSPR